MTFKFSIFGGVLTITLSYMPTQKVIDEIIKTLEEYGATNVSSIN
jgi:hypothetical protein